MILVARLLSVQIPIFVQFECVIQNLIYDVHLIRGGWPEILEMVCSFETKKKIDLLI